MKNKCEDLIAAKEWYRIAKEQDNKLAIEILENKFPELKESEDERVRNFLIGYFDKLIDENSEWGLTKETREKIITWLEKQGNLMKALQISNAKIGELIEENYYLKEKQGEQKHADKVEPKYNVGDWLVHNERKHIVKVVNRTPFFYKVVNILGYHYTIINDAIENNYHLWTIQDAKDGDVLATDDCNICVFDGTVEDGKYPFAYYGLIRCKFGSYDRKLPFTHDSIHPATKEQLDLLFQKMKEAGYEWDADKKELKKIEQKPSGWSDEDEKMIDDIIETASHHCYLSITNINWLKSLKDRFCPQKHWKPTEEQIGALEHLIDSTISSHTFMLKELVKQLKAL